MFLDTDLEELQHPQVVTVSTHSYVFMITYSIRNSAYVMIKDG